jgi:hypothetical protein
MTGSNVDQTHPLIKLYIDECIDVANKSNVYNIYTSIKFSNSVGMNSKFF